MPAGINTINPKPRSTFFMAPPVRAKALDSSLQLRCVWISTAASPIIHEIYLCQEPTRWIRRKTGGTRESGTLKQRRAPVLLNHLTGNLIDLVSRDFPAR